MFVDYDLRKQEELENRLTSAALPRRSDGSIASSGQSPEIPSLLRRPGTMLGPLFSGSSCPSENPENPSNSFNQIANFFKYKKRVSKLCFLRFEFENRLTSVAILHRGVGSTAFLGQPRISSLAEKDRELCRSHYSLHPPVLEL